MEPQATAINSFTLAFALVAGVLVLFLNRRNAIVPFLFAALLLPMNQGTTIGGINLYMLRIFILVGWARITIRGEFRAFHLNTIDKILIAWVIMSIVSYTLLWQTGAALVNRLGIAYVALGVYFILRILIRDSDDVIFTIKVVAVLAVLVGTCMLGERYFGRNFFFYLGGVPEFTASRMGKLRCQGPFLHSILAGTFGAIVIPLFVALQWKAGKWKKLEIIGIVSALIIVLNSSSSAPVLTCLVGIVALLMWPFHRYIKVFRWVMLFLVIGLHMIMQAPVWALVGRVRVFGGSTGYHRFNLIDQFLRRFEDWWLVGVKSTGEWGHYLFDVSNMYVRIGVDGGLFNLLLFIALIVFSFRNIGNHIISESTDSNVKKFYWGLGSALFVHTVSFMGSSYWDQIIVMWYWTLAMISSGSVSPAHILNNSPVTVAAKNRSDKCKEIFVRG